MDHDTHTRQIKKLHILSKYIQCHFEIIPACPKTQIVIRETGEQVEMHHGVANHTTSNQRAGSKPKPKPKVEGLGVLELLGVKK